MAEGTKANGDQRSQRRPTVAVGNCTPFAIGKEYNTYILFSMMYYDVQGVL